MISNRNTATTRGAGGFIAPYIRVATHLGYCCAIANTTDKPFADRKRDIQTDLREALSHLDNQPSASAFISADIISDLGDIREDIAQMADGEFEEDTFLIDLQNCCHNLASAMARADHDIIGQPASAGTEI